MTSPFLQIPETFWVASNELAFAIFDKYPVNDGHILVIPKRLTPTWFEATAQEQLAIMTLVEEAKAILDKRFQPDGYNIGINVGEAAGQTVMHLHVHVIPRFRGDMDDPRGGVRHVIPWKGNYLDDSNGEASAALSTGGENHFLRHLRPLFAEARQVDIVAAFVQDSGLRLLSNTLRSALERGVQIRLLTGDYFQITQVEALQRLLDWRESAAVMESGSLEVRVVEVGSGKAWPKSFHPKSWAFVNDAGGVAYVGSSNISYRALTDGVEWNLRVQRRVDPQAFGQVEAAFKAQWSAATTLSAEWIGEYRRRVQAAPPRPPIREPEAEEGRDKPTPRAVQAEALLALKRARLQGRRRALVVHATGLGKTWLAAFDVEAFADYIHRPPRVLFLAHRVEILRQAADTFRELLGPEARFGWFVGDKSSLEGDVVFGSVQKLTLEQHLESIDADAFDYLIVDEVHHASAPSYRRILNHLDPGFVLGLTATPDRADEADIRVFFDDFIAHRVNVGEGIERGVLCAFRYFGIRDVVDFAPIPWRSGRFQIEELTAQVATEERMQRVWEAMTEQGGARSLLFCCSINHARFVRQWLQGKGLRVAAIFSGKDSDDRETALEALAAGSLDAVCAVDILNEGVDIPAIDRVVMLRPTESPVVFMQQLGRGLRRADGKDALVVLDFVGNHRVFLDRVRMLLSLGEKSVSLREFLLKGITPELPPGCSLDIEIDAIDLLKELLPSSSRSALTTEYRELQKARGTRPRAVELYRLDLNLSALRSSFGGWFGFIDSEGDLATEAEQRAWALGQDWFREVETTALNKCYKMVVLQALLDADALFESLPIDELSMACHGILARSPELFLDIVKVKELSNPREPERETWVAYWDKWPLSIWAGDAGREIESPWFSRVEGFFRPNLPMPEEEATKDAFVEMTRELVELRLAQYRDRRAGDAESVGAFRTQVVTIDGDPALSIPDRKDIPSGELTAALPSGQKWRFRIHKKHCRIGRPVGQRSNSLPDLLRVWFGPAAGDLTAAQVEFRPSPDGWQLEPIGIGIIPFARPGRIIAFPSMAAAAGTHRPDSEHPPQWQERAVCADLHDMAAGADFAIPVVGDSMNGGDAPIRDGSWALMRWARGASLAGVLNRVALVEVRHEEDPEEDPERGPQYLLKRVVCSDNGFELRSDNPATPSITATDQSVVIAVHVATLRDEDFLSSREAALIDALEVELLDVEAFEAYAADFQNSSEALRALVDFESELSRPQGLASALVDRLGLSSTTADACSVRIFARVSGDLLS